MPNPTGFNQGNVFQPEVPYGQIKRLQELVQQAPIPPNSALTAPKRAQRKAVRPSPQPEPQQPQQQPQAAAPAPPPTPPYPVMLSQLLAGIEGADGSLPNITWLAQQAAREAE